MENEYTTCTSPKTKTSVSIWDYVKKVITPDFGPRTSIANRFGTDSTKMAKVFCAPDHTGKNNECYFYCPNAKDPSSPKKINLRFRCLTRAGAWKPKVSPRLRSKLTCKP